MRLSLCFLQLQVSSKLTLANSIFYCCATADTNKWTSTVHHTEEVVSMYQARRMTPQQLALIWQVFWLHFTHVFVPTWCRSHALKLERGL